MNKCLWHNERAIQYYLYLRLCSGARVITPNFRPVRWHECDLFHVTKSGYWHEHEIKITRADFRNDAKKTEKHRALERGDPPCPNQFWYVSPEGIIPESDVPEWAGLKYVTGPGRIKIVKRAPRLHENKVDPREVERAFVACYHRCFGRLI